MIGSNLAHITLEFRKRLKQQKLLNNKFIMYKGKMMVVKIENENIYKVGLDSDYLYIFTISLYSLVLYLINCNPG